MSDVFGALAAPFLDPGERTFWPGLGVACVLAVLLPRGGRSVREALGLVAGPSTTLDLELLVLRRLLAVVGLGTGWLGATGLARATATGLRDAFGSPDPPPPVLAALVLAWPFVWFVAADASRFLLHLALHRVPMLWAFHQVHHSAEVLSPLTFHRTHPVEALLYGLRGVVVAGGVGGIGFWLGRGALHDLTFLGVNALGFGLTCLSGNLRHSHVWWRFPAWLERHLLSPAQHQVHHGVGTDGHNLGVWLAWWDRLAGTFLPSPAAPPVTYGLAASARNHDHRLASALLGPFGDALRRLPGLAALAAFGGTARAETPMEDEPYEVEVVGAEALARVAGSAHVVGEEELARFDYDDIQRVLAKVPGVYVRGEDGFGLRPNIGMRGGSSDRSAKIALLHDGIPLAPAPYAAPAAYYFPIASRFVGVEVYKGPAAIRFGPQTIGGAVNVTTRPVPTRAEGRVDASYGSFGTAQALVYAGAGTEARGLSIEGAQLSSDGFKVLDGGGSTGFARQDLTVKGAWAPSAAHRLELTGGVGRESSNETYLGLSGDDFAATPYRRYAASALDRMVWLHTEQAARWAWTPSPHASVSTVAYAHSLARSWTKVNRFADGPELHDLLLSGGGGQADVFLDVLRGSEDAAGEGQVLALGTNDRRFVNGGVQSTLTLRHWQGESVASDLETGVRVHTDDARRLHTEDPYRMTEGVLSRTHGPTEVVLDSHTTALALAAFAAEDLRLGKTHLLPGLRVEGVTTRAGTIEAGPTDPVGTVIALPGLGALTEVRPWLSVLAGIHRGWSPVPPGTGRGVAPETAWNGEGGVRVEAGSHHVEAIGFASSYRNLIGLCTLSAGCADDQLDRTFDAGEAFVGGVEALATGSVPLPHRLTFGATASWTYTVAWFSTSFSSEFPQWGDVTAGDALPYVPTHQGAVSATLEHRAFGLASSVLARSGLLDAAGPVGGAGEPGFVPGMAQWDASGWVRVDDHARLYGTVTNVLDSVILESWRPFGARPAAPRQLTLGVRVAPRPDR